MKLKKYEFNHIPWVALVDEFDCPACPYASAYLSTLAGQAFNTQLRKANELLFVLDYFKKRGVSLVDRVRSGKLITESEYSQFWNASASKKASGDFSEASVVVLGVSDKFLRNAMSANVNQRNCVQSETKAGRVRRLRKYLEMLYEHFHDAYSVDPALAGRYEKLTAKIKLDENSIGRNKARPTVASTDSSIPDEVFCRMLEMIHPSSPNNPFKGSRIRNYLMVSTLCDTGIRRGALAKMKISDLMLHGTFDQIRIYKTGIDQTESRREKGNQKTPNAHYAHIHQKLMHQIKFYIDHVRFQIPGTDKHDFIFVSEKNSRGTLGVELSLKSINGIFNVISESLGFHVHPHLLRHKWNEVFSEKGRSQGKDYRVVEEARKYAMGWEPNSSMNATYNDVDIAATAREISLKHQRKIDEQK